MVARFKHVEQDGETEGERGGGRGGGREAKQYNEKKDTTWEW